MCPPWTDFVVDSLSGLVVGQASYGGVSQAAGAAAATVEEVIMEKALRGRKSCSGATDVAWAHSWAHKRGR